MFICFGIVAVLLLIYLILGMACGFDLSCGGDDTAKKERLLFEESGINKLQMTKVESNSGNIGNSASITKVDSTKSKITEKRGDSLRFLN